MKKGTMILCAILAACLIAAVGCWAYYETEMSLGDALPDHVWTDAVVFEGVPGVGESEIAGAELASLLSAMEQTAVTRGPAFRGISQPYFMIHLQHGNGPATLIYVLENGQISIAPDYDTDNYHYYEGGEALYQALTATLS